jgi:hypothetical protein
MEWATDTPTISATDSAGRMDLLARLVGFGLLVGLGVVIIAGVVLLPAYARLLEARYQRDCLLSVNAQDNARILSCRRLIEAIPEDPVLAKRIAMREFGTIPRAERVLHSATVGQAPLVQTPRQARAPAPNPRVIAAAKVLEAPGKRHVLALLGAATILGGMILSGRSRRWARREPTSPAPPAP